MEIATHADTDKPWRFQPGNKAAVGRGRRWADHMAHARKYAPECIEYLVSVVRDESARRADRINAAAELLDRGLGRPVQGHVIQSTPSEDVAPITSTMSPAEAAELYSRTIGIGQVMVIEAPAIEAEGVDP